MSEQPFDIDALLDGQLDDLADTPEFKPFVPGSYKIMFGLSQDNKKTKGIYFGKMKMVEVLELADPSNPPPVKDDETSTRFDMSNEFGQGNMKKVLSAMIAKFGKGPTNREWIDKLMVEDVECTVITDLRPNKDKTVFYTNLVEIMVN